MRIVINCRSILLKQRTGIGRYTYQLLDCIGQIDKGNEYILHAPNGLFDFNRRLPVFPAYPNLKRYPDYFKWSLSSYDLYHFPCPDDLDTNGKLIVTVHDLIHKVYPECHTDKTIALTEKYITTIAAKAERIICTSENTRCDLHRYFDIPREKSCVIYSGVDTKVFYHFSPQQRLGSAGRLKSMGIDGPFVLYVGTIEPRKNLTGLLESFSILRSKNGFNGQLVVAGMKGWMVESVAGSLKKLGIDGKVVFTGYVGDDLLCQLYNMAEVFVFPSFYEGFGFPILEAFACGTAVIVSNTSSCAEIAGEAALKVDPKDNDQLAQAMRKVLTDSDLKGSLRKSGLRRVAQFSVMDTARKTLDLYRQIA